MQKIINGRLILNKLILMQHKMFLLSPGFGSRYIPYYIIFMRKYKGSNAFTSRKDSVKIAIRYSYSIESITNVFYFQSHITSLGYECTQIFNKVINFIKKTTSFVLIQYRSKIQTLSMIRANIKVSILSQMHTHIFRHSTLQWLV